MEELLCLGKVKHIGVSNYRRDQMEQLLKLAKHRPDVIQIELHPYLAQRDYVRWLQSEGIVVQAYSPLGNLNPGYKRGDEPLTTEHEVIVDIARKHGRTPAQTILSWNAARDVVVLPKSVTPGRIEENLGIFELDEDDVRRINALDAGRRYCEANELWQHRWE